MKTVWNKTRPKYHYFDGKIFLNFWKINSYNSKNAGSGVDIFAKIC